MSNQAINTFNTFSNKADNHFLSFSNPKTMIFINDFIIKRCLGCANKKIRTNIRNALES